MKPMATAAISCSIRLAVAFSARRTFYLNFNIDDLAIRATAVE